MKDYYRILELSADATEEQVRAQYKRLVRIYHPDRFTNSQDKSYVEEKLIEINEAYRALLARSGKRSVQVGGGDLHAHATTHESLPQPVALPATLDFGALPRGERKALLFQLQNLGGVVQRFQLDYSDNSGWFKVTKGRRLQSQQPFPMEFAVVVDTSRLNPGQDYSGWIQIDMDTATARVPVSVQVATPKLFAFLTPRIVIALSMLTIVALLVATQVFDFVLPIFSQSPRPITTAKLVTQQPAELLVNNPTLVNTSDVPEVLPVNNAGGSDSIQLQNGPVVGAEHTTPSRTFVPVAATKSSNLLQNTPATPAVVSITVAATIVGRSRLPFPTSNRALQPPEAHLQQTSVATPNDATANSTVTTPSSTMATMSAAPSATVIKSTATVSKTPTPLRTRVSASIASSAPTATPSPHVTNASSPTTLPSSTATTQSTATPTFTPTATSTPIATSTPTAISTPTATPTPAPTPTPTSTFTAMPTVTNTPVPAPTLSSTPTTSATPTRRATATDLPTPTVATTVAVTEVATTVAVTEVATPIVGATLFVPFPTSEVPSTRIIVLIPDTYSVNARSDISVNADIVQVLASGTQWPAVGRTIDSTWLYLQLDDERFAWVFRETIGVSLDEINALPVIIPDAFQ